MADQASPEQPGEVKPGETITPAEQGNNPDEDHKREEDSETFKALHTCAIYEGKPPYIDPKGARGKPYGPPPIQDWANKLIGKRLVAESAVGNSMTFKRSDLPDHARIHPGGADFMDVRQRLNVDMNNKEGVVKGVYYG
ncbi:MAG: hypothetical protein L6R39_004444 [Caloplaca ligustica]|nr:MAG: hypothetical protein L6R39_004444 [Caloplaca ligustica]